jgi:hypothetical protein
MSLEALYTCEQCNEMLTESETHIQTAQGYREVITLAWCGDCWEGR